MTKDGFIHSFLRGLAWLVLLPPLCSLSPVAAAVESAPNPPCGAGTGPAYPLPGALPVARVWHGAGLTQWQPPACLGWRGQDFSLLVTLAGSFRYAGSADDLLAGFGAASAYRGIRYWSVTDRHWQTLITDSAALADPAGAHRRADFTPAEMRPGGDLYFLQDDNRSSGDVVYRMRVLESARNRLVVTTENITGLRLFVLTLFSPADLQSTYFLEPVAPGVWGYYSVFGVREHFVARLGSHEASYENRALALFRHFAGIPTDQDPPPAY